MKLTSIPALFLVALVSFGVRAEFKPPALSAPVVDEAGLLSSSTVQQLDSLLRQVKSMGGTQIAVVIVSTLDGTPIEQAGIKAADVYKLGSQKEDDGVLLLVAVKERAIRIEVGQGREGVLPDVIAKRIIADVMVPQFRSGDPDQAVRAGVLNILQSTDPEILNKLAGDLPKARRSRGEGVPGWAFILFMIFIIFLRAVAGPPRRRAFGSHWPHGGGFGSGGGFGGGSFGGGSSGGWSGGGGGFSGGGASGNW